MRVAIVGATGMVGRELLQVLEERNFPVTELSLFASEKSAGEFLHFRETPWRVEALSQRLNGHSELVFLTAGSEISRKYAQIFVMEGAIVIDNSSAWRLDPHVPLIVPEVNLEHISHSRLIANPNCSTIQLVVVLAPLHQAFGLRRVVVCTYQAVTGSGYKGVNQLLGERENKNYRKYYPHPIDLNVIPQCDHFEANGYTVEEMKIIRETRKILNLPNLNITATCVRVPVLGGHSEAVNIEFEDSFTLAQVYKVLRAAPGLVITDENKPEAYPIPLKVRGKNEVYVGRIRKDDSVNNGINLWIVADNLRKGAATNAVQIAEKVLFS
ncbi:MAG: aspartate-semialdehyde dehydrogenase [Bacteroidia bacterium]|nr:aspartate-semialdehyde dehydrogenase [Bacteroidia bacterium]MDW8159228.1 aspartate-semialdehyde dehydrogenase [Bacteroidia bacterium]